MITTPTTAYAAAWSLLQDLRCCEAGAGLLLDAFARLAREERAGGGTDLREELGTIVGDNGDGGMVNEWLQTFEADREAFRDVARNWFEDCRGDVPYAVSRRPGQPR